MEGRHLRLTVEGGRYSVGEGAGNWLGRGVGTVLGRGVGTLFGCGVWRSGLHWVGVIWRGRAHLILM